MRPTRFLRTLAVTLSATAALLLQAGAAHAWNPNARFCFRDVINTPDTFAQPPNIDGVISGDNGWTSSWRYVFNNGTYIHDAVVQGIKDANFVYLSFEVNHDTEFSPDDAIVIAFDPTGAAANRRLLQIFPVIPAGAASPIPMLYWQGFPWAGAGAAPPAGTQAAATTSGPAGNRSWFVELKIPRSAFGIPAAGDFGMYFNVVPVNVDLAVEHPWPPDSPSMMLDLKNTPDINGWGQATVAAVTCNGVFITSTDIRTDNVPPSKINLNAPNTFRATVHNTTIDGTGAFIPANGINATFRIANFGLPSKWQAVPATGPATNPTAAVNIGANSTTDLTTSWTLSAGEQAQYDTPSTRHQCILVELDSQVGTCVGGTNPGASCNPAGCTGGGTCAPTVFSQKSAWTNMNFGTASQVAFQAEIDPRGWKRPPQGQTRQRLELLVTRQIDQLRREEVLKWLQASDNPTATRAAAVGGQRFAVADGGWASLKQLTHFPVERDANFKEYFAQLQKPEAVVTQLTYLVHGCRRSGDFLNIHGNKYELCERVGSYGYVARHAGLGTTAWSVGLRAPELKQVGQLERFQIQVPADRPVAVSNQLAAIDKAPEGSGKKGCGSLKVGSAEFAGGTLAIIGGAVYWPLRRRRNKQ